MRTAKPAAKEIQTSVQPMASRKPTTCFVRWNTPRSSASSASTNRLNRTQNNQFEGMGRISEQPFYLADLNRGDRVQPTFGTASTLLQILRGFRACVRTKLGICQWNLLAENPAP